MSEPRVPIEGHPGYWRRGSVVVFKYRDDRRRQRWGSAATIAAAKRRRAELQTDVSRGDFRSSSRVAFADYARSWVDTYPGRTSRGLTPATRNDYRARLERDVIPYFAGMRLDEIEPHHVRGLAAEVAGRGVSRNTVRLAIAPLRALLATAHEDGMLRSNPAAGVRVMIPTPAVEPDDSDADTKAMTVEQLGRLLAELPAEWRLFFRVLANLGLRVGEAVELRWHDIDRGTLTVRVRRNFYMGSVGAPKSRYGKRTLRLTPELDAALWEHRKKTRATDRDLVFTGARGDRIVQANLARRVLKPAAVRAGLGEKVKTKTGHRYESWVSFHTFRHTCASVLFASGWNVVQVQRWLGHHSPAFTLGTYIHLLEDDVPDAIAVDPEPAIGKGGTSGGTQTGRDVPKSAKAACAGNTHG